MHEAATILMRSTPGWIEHQTSDATFLFQFGDAMMTVFPNGNWRCVAPQSMTQAVRQGSMNNLGQFLKDFAAANSA